MSEARLANLGGDGLALSPDLASSSPTKRRKPYPPPSRAAITMPVKNAAAQVSSNTFSKSLAFMAVSPKKAGIREYHNKPLVFWFPSMGG